MKKIILSLAALAAVVGTVQATDQPIDVTATVTTFCSIDTDDVGPRPKKTINLGTFGATGIAAANTGTLAASLAVVCNAPSDVTLTSANGALVNITGTGTLQKYITYTADTTGFPTAQAKVVASTKTGATGSAVTGAVAKQSVAFSGNVNVVVTPDAAATLAAGDFKDVLTLSIAPQ